MLQSPLRSPYRLGCAEFLKGFLSSRRAVHCFLPFSGELEISLLRDGFDVLMHTNNFPIYEFWACFKTDPFRIAAHATSLHRNMNSDLIHLFQKDWIAQRDPYVRSALFFLLNRYSQTGTISSGRLRLHNYRPTSLLPLNQCDKRILELKINYHNTEDSLAGLAGVSPDECALIIPGEFAGGFMDLQYREGHEAYSYTHRNLKRAAQESGAPFVMIYKAHPGVLHLYSDCNIVFLNAAGEQTEHHKYAAEYIITNMGKP
jgi:hypothetical protein